MLKIQGELEFAGDKSLSHRAALFSALSAGHSTLINYLPAQDTMNMLQVMQTWGVEVHQKEHIEVVSVGLASLKSMSNKKNLQVNVGNSGTAARLLLGLFAGIEGLRVTIDGDASLRKRPMQRITQPLAEYGAEFDSDYLPLTVTGKKLLPIVFKEHLGSAQVKSAIMLAALTAQVDLRLQEQIPSRDHSENMLAFAEVPVSKRESNSGFVIEMEQPYELQAKTYQIWGDISSAAFFVVLALLAKEGSLVIKNVLLNPYRAAYLQVLKRMGARIEIKEHEPQCGERGGDLIVYPSTLQGVDISAEEIPALIDELPILTIAGLFASGSFSFRGAQELRVKESDRIFALCENLRNCKVEVTEYEDGLRLNGNPQTILDASIVSFMDHRIVMSFEIAKILSQANSAKTNLKIEGQQWIKTSFPSFYDKLKEVVYD